MAKKIKQSRKKSLFLAFFITILILAAFYKAGWLIYDYYFKKTDTIVQIIPNQAYFYAHWNIDERKDPYKTLAKIVQQKSTLTAMQEKIQGLTETFLQKFDINLANDWQPLVKQEMALAFLESAGKNYPLIIIQTNSAVDFERKIINKLRKEQSLSVTEYAGYKIKNFHFPLAEFIDNKEIDLYLESSDLFYTTIEDKILIANNQTVINQAIDTFMEKNKSIKDKIPSQLANKFFYSYLKPDNLNWDSLNWKIWQQQLAENDIEEFFISLEMNTGNINFVIEDEKSIFEFNNDQTTGSQLLAYLPEDFKWAVWEKEEMPNLTEYYQKKLNNFFSQKDENSLKVLLSLLPDEDLFKNVFDQETLLVTNHDEHYLLIAQIESNQTDQALAQTEQAIKRISSLTNPSEQTISYQEGEKAIELIPDIGQVVVTPENGLGQRFFSVPFYDQKIIYGLNDQFTLISSSAEFIEQSLTSDKKIIDYQNIILNCPQAQQSGIFISPLSNINWPLIGQFGSAQEFFAAFVNLEKNNLSLNGCLIIK